VPEAISLTVDECYNDHDVSVGVYRSLHGIRVMKCQECEKPATFHITELTGPAPKELHLCEEHARAYLTFPETTEPSAPGIGQIAEQLKIGQTAEELSRIDQQSCPVCGITFYEFRNQGRLGCPYDYTCFADELDPLLVNIHGELQHKGKRPRHVESQRTQLTEVIRLRREMKDAVTREDYETASKLRDQIRALESGG
jgi:protein arginine kinase activator